MIEKFWNNASPIRQKKFRNINPCRWQTNSRKISEKFLPIPTVLTFSKLKFFNIFLKMQPIYSSVI